jgi:hypothetical protein
MEFSDKKKGYQVGFILRIKIANDPTIQEINFHVKTHQYTVSTIQKTDDINKELFVYKFLNRIELLSQVHFYYCHSKDDNNIIQFCIATMDVEDYSYLLKKNETDYNFYALLDNHRLNSTITKHQDFTFCLTFLDIVSRIFNLTDCLTNDANYGLITNGISLKLYAYDFKIDESITYGYKSNPILNQFFTGNTIYNYKNSCEQVLTNRDLKLKIKDAKMVVEKLLDLDYHELLKECYCEFYNYLQESDSLKSFLFKDLNDLTMLHYESDPEAYDDFNKYVMFLKENFNQFKNDLEKIN